jgi:hypothetical protein
MTQEILFWSSPEVTVESIIILFSYSNIYQQNTSMDIYIKMPSMNGTQVVLGGFQCLTNTIHFDPQEPWEVGSQNCNLHRGMSEWRFHLQFINGQSMKPQTKNVPILHHHIWFISFRWSLTLLWRVFKWSLFHARCVAYLGWDYENGDLIKRPSDESLVRAQTFWNPNEHAV